MRDSIATASCEPLNSARWAAQSPHCLPRCKSIP